MVYGTARGQRVFLTKGAYDRTMKERGIIDKILHFLVHNSNFVTVAVMCAVHVVLLFMMMAAGVIPLVEFNILSVVVYLFCVFLCKAGYLMPVYISICVEVSTYTVLSTYFLGLRCGTYCFLFSIVPIIIYLGCFLFQGAKRWIIVLLLALNFAIFAALYIMFIDVPPIYEIHPGIRLALILFSSFVMVVSTIVYNTIYIYSSEVEKAGLEKENRQLSTDAHEDALTGLLNRRGFLPIMERQMEIKNNYFCVAFCDIDNFKRINDSYGHDAGDEVLRHIAAILRKEMTGCDICRWGGEEMIILMRDYDMAVAKEKMEYVRRTIETSPTIFYNKRIPATVTIGVEERREVHKEAEEIIKIADERMYYGKQHGKNIVVCEGGTDPE